MASRLQGVKVRRIMPEIRSLLSSPLARLGATVVIFMAILATVGPSASPYDPIKVNLSERFVPPSLNHPFGTDQLGMDVLSRSLSGVRISFAVGLAVIIGAALVGGLAGAISGFYGGRVDTVLMRITDLFLTFPILVFATFLVAALGGSIINSVIAMIVTWWARYARVMRSSVLTVKENEYVEAAVATGESKPNVLLHYVLPNSIAPLLVQATQGFSEAVLLASALGFLGLGAKPPTPELGNMVAVGIPYTFDQWWIVAFPGAFILLIALGFNLLGDALRDYMDPRLRL